MATHSTVDTNAATFSNAILPLAQSQVGDRLVEDTTVRLPMAIALYTRI